MSVALRIREVLTERQMTQASFARLCGVRPSVIRDVLREKQRPTVEVLAALSRLPGVDITSVLDGHEKPHYRRICGVWTQTKRRTA